MFGYLSFTTVQGQKIGFNSCECIKFLNIANFHACMGETHIKLQWYNIFPLLFFLLQRNFFPRWLHHQTSMCNQALLFTELRLLQGTL